MSSGAQRGQGCGLAAGRTVKGRNGCCCCWGGVEGWGWGWGGCVTSGYVSAEAAACRESSSVVVRVLWSAARGEADKCLPVVQESRATAHLCEAAAETPTDRDLKTGENEPVLSSHGVFMDLKQFIKADLERVVGSSRLSRQEVTGWAALAGCLHSSLTRLL